LNYISKGFNTSHQPACIALNDSAKIFKLPVLKLPLQKFLKRDIIMKKIAKIFLFSFVFLVITGSSAVAQKYGHLNSGNLLVQMPETKKADEELRAYQDSLVKKGEEMANALKEHFAQVNDDYNKGLLSPLQAQKKQEELEKKKDELSKYQQEVTDKVGKKREELFTPILDKVQVAIDAVGKENGYKIIFDSSIPNVILFAVDTDNVEALVKAKLGL